MVPSTLSTSSQSRAASYHFPPASSTSESSQPRTGQPPTSASSSIRPRNRRLLSTEQELLTSISGSSSPVGGASREASPIPRRYPSRVVGAGGGGGSGSGSVRGRNGTPVGGLLVPQRDEVGERVMRGGNNPSPVGVGMGTGLGGVKGGGGWWDGSWSSSWSALQGLANSVLGGDSLEDGGIDGNVRNGTGKRHKKTSFARDLPAAWGPEGLKKVKDQGIGVGSTTDREAKLKTRRMAGLLEGREADESRMLDTTGNYKRRTSLEEARQDSHDDGGDALAYIHHVQPQDTLAGVVLKYNCQPAVFRKANRFWPNDSIQTRNVVVLPVDACTMKGRPCEAPTAERPDVDLLAPTPATENAPPFENGGKWPPGAFSSSQNETFAERTEGEEEHPWVHVRWVLLDSSPTSRPVEIARMPRRTLGYFPPRRRRSQNTLSAVSTPRDSIDFPQISRSSSQDRTAASPLTTHARQTSNPSARPSSQSGLGSYFPPLSSTSARPRRESVGEAAERMGWMRRPGGVGTFGKNVRMPGPANDGLNTWAKKHIPGLAIDGLPSTSILAAESARLGFGGGELGRIVEGPATVGGSGTITPSLGQGNGSGGLGLENAAAAIEGWVRRLAIKPGTPKLKARNIVPADGTDLIELLDGTGSDDGRGFELNPGSVRSGTPVGGASGREDLDAVVRGTGGAGLKAGKSD